MPSTIVDARTSRLAIVRSGAIDAATLATVVPHLAAEVDDAGPSAETEAEPA